VFTIGFVMLFVMLIDMLTKQNLVFSCYVVLVIYIIVVVVPIKTRHSNLLLHVVTEPAYLFLYCCFIVLCAYYVDFGIALLMAIMLSITKFDVDMLSNL
jgi:hypothetical protein